jgi:hypothetical protein
MGPSVGGLGRIGLACGGTIKCKGTTGGAQVTCVGAMGCMGMVLTCIVDSLCVCMLSSPDF